MKNIIFLLSIVVFSQALHGQIAGVIPSASSIASTSVADTHAWSAFHNPAMLGYPAKPELGLMVENRFLLKELSTKCIQFAFPTALLNTGLSFSHFGYSFYHEMLFGIGFARNFSNHFALGVRFNYYTAYYSASNSYHGAFLPQLGLSVRLTPEFSLGFNTFNPFQTNIQTEYVMKRLPSLFSLGTEYFFSKDFVWRTQVDKEVSSNYRVATGFEYHMLQNFAFKLGGYSSVYLIPCLGVACKTGAFLFDLNCEMHPLLGLTTQASIEYSFGK